MSNTSLSETLEAWRDADDAYSLSGLVRTGEASRLRRRATFRIDHSGRPAAERWSRPPLQPLVLVPPPPETISSRPPMTPPRQTSAYAANSSGLEEDENEDGSEYKLYCGVLETGLVGDSDPFTPSPLPAYPSMYEESGSPSRTLRKSSGCGTLVHTRGVPRTCTGTWHALGDATDIVIPLDPVYFDCGGKTKHFSCGCRFYGVGCSVW